MRARWGESGNRLGRTFLPLPSLQSMGSLSDRSGPLDPSKPPLPPPQSTMARGLPINPSFPTRPTSGYHFPVSKSYKHLICTTPPAPPPPLPAPVPPPTCVYILDARKPLPVHYKPE